MLYRMKLKFALTFQFKDLNQILDQCGFLNEHPEVKDAKIVSIEQTVPFIPDEATLEKYKVAIQENYQTNTLVCTDIRFLGYEYLMPVKAPKQPVKNIENKDSTEKRYLVLVKIFNGTYWLWDRIVEYDDEDSDTIFLSKEQALDVAKKAAENIVALGPDIIQKYDKDAKGKECHINVMDDEVQIVTDEGCIIQRIMAARLADELNDIKNIRCHDWLVMEEPLSEEGPAVICAIKRHRTGARDVMLQRINTLIKEQNMTLNQISMTEMLEPNDFVSLQNGSKFVHISVASDRWNEHETYRRKEYTS